MTELPPGVTYAYRNVQGYPDGHPLAANHHRYRANDRAAKGVSPPAQKATLNGPKWIDTRIKLSSVIFLMHVTHKSSVTCIKLISESCYMHVTHKSSVAYMELLNKS